MTEAALKKMVDAFLTWTLPDDVCVDAIACQAGHPHRTGTTLLTAAQARAMFQHVLEAVEMRPTYVAPDAAIEFDAAIDAARGES